MLSICGTAHTALAQSAPADLAKAVQEAEALFSAERTESQELKLQHEHIQAQQDKIADLEARRAHAGQVQRAQLRVNAAQQDVDTCADTDECEDAADALRSSRQSLADTQQAFAGEARTAEQLQTGIDDLTERITSDLSPDFGSAAQLQEAYELQQAETAAAYTQLHEARAAVHQARLAELEPGSLAYTQERLGYLQAERRAAADCAEATSPEVIDCTVFFDTSDQEDFYNTNARTIELRRQTLQNDSVNVGSLLSVGGEASYDNLTDLVSTVIDALTLLIGTASLIFIVVGGFRMVVSGGDDTELTRAKEMVKYAVIGLVITLLAYIIVVAVQALIYR